jgi:hypothetical protein
MEARQARPAYVGPAYREFAEETGALAVGALPSDVALAARLNQACPADNAMRWCRLD